MDTSELVSLSFVVNSSGGNLGWVLLGCLGLFLIGTSLFYIFNRKTKASAKRYSSGTLLVSLFLVVGAGVGYLMSLTPTYDQEVRSAIENLDPNVKIAPATVKNLFKEPKIGSEDIFTVRYSYAGKEITKKAYYSVYAGENSTNYMLTEKIPNGEDVVFEFKPLEDASAE